MKKYLLLILIILQLNNVNASSIDKNNKEKVLFSKCMDGDTAKFIIHNEEKTVRFLAINAPEVEHKEQEIKEEPYGSEASDYTCQLLTNAKEIILEYDKKSAQEDKYGRVLAFVYVDNQMIEEKLLEKGYAKIAYVYDDYEHLDELKKIEERAKKNKKGIWQEEKEILGEEEEENTLVSIITKVIDFAIELVKKIFALFD